MARLIIILSILISVSFRLYFILSGKHVGDINLLFMMGKTLTVGDNPYLVYDYYVYGPLALLLERFCILLSDFIPLPFHMISKFFPNLADFLTAFLLYKYFIKTKIKKVTAAAWIALFILNPISIATSSAQGQLDSIFSLFVLLSVYFLTYFKDKKYFYTSALMLGISIAIKPNPVMLVPFFVGFKKTFLKQKLTYLILTIVPLAFTLAPFLLQDPLKVINRIAGYSGIFDMGLAAILRGIWFQINASIDPPLVGELFAVNKLTFIAAYISLILIFWGSKKLVKLIILTYLTFLSLYFGISIQYLVWLIPFAILDRNKMVIPYLILGSLALLGFYLFLAQNILLGNLSTDAPLQVKNVYLYFYGNLLFWIFCLFWLIKIIRGELRSRILEFGKVRKYALYFGSLIFVLSTIPTISILIQIVKSLFSERL